MKRGIKDICLFGLGAAVGSAVTYILVKTKFEKLADDEVASVRAAFDKRIAELDEMKSSLDGEIIGSETIEDDEERPYAKEKVSEVVRNLNNKPPLTDYTKYFRENAENAKMQRETEEDELAESEHPEDDEPYSDEEDKMQTLEYIDHELNGASREAIRDDKPPYVIDRESYELTCNHYDKLDLLYYIHDDILCDDDNTEIGRMVLIGTCIEESGFADNEDESLFVRNDKTMTDFEITKIYTPYEGK